MTTYPKFNHALYCVQIGKENVLAYTFTLSLSFSFLLLFSMLCTCSSFVVIAILLMVSHISQPLDVDLNLSHSEHLE
jgi:hypothetical protein